MSSQFEFDLDQIDQVTARARSFKEFFVDRLDGLESRIQGLVQSGVWTGESAAAYAKAHRDWMVAAREVVEGLAQMEQAAQAAHGSYSDAMDVNLRMTGDDVAVIAPQSYYTAAEACYKLSTEFQTAYNSLQTVLFETGGMAGSYQAAKAWSDSYDERGGAFTAVATGFAQALTHFGDILIASGYNWECANYVANRDPNKGIGPSCPRTIPSELPYGAGIVVGVTSSRDNGRGLETDFPELYDKVVAKLAGGEISDGDTDKLDRAAKAWKAFADDNAIFAAEARLRVVADGLSKFDAPDIPNLTAHLRTLSTSAGQIKLAADDLAKSTASHHTALIGLRSDINTQVTATLVVASVVIAVTLVRIRNPRLATVEGTALDTAATSIAGVIGTSFTALSGITFSTAALAPAAFATITGLTILSIAGDTTFNSTTSRRPTRMTPMDRRRLAVQVKRKDSCRPAAVTGGHPTRTVRDPAGRTPKGGCGFRPGRARPRTAVRIGTCRRRKVVIPTCIWAESRDERHR